ATFVQVEYEDAEAITDPLAAMREGAPAVLDEEESASDEDASLHGASAEADEAPDERPRNVSGVAHLKRGDAEAALRQSDVVIRATYRMAGAHHSFLEPHIAIARPEPDGGLTVWSPTQGPFVVRDSVANLLGL